jgi:hypothetical protein
MELADVRAAVAVIVPPAYDVNDLSSFRDEDNEHLGTDEDKQFRAARKKRKAERRRKLPGKTVASEGDDDDTSASSSSCSSSSSSSSSSSTFSTSYASRASSSYSSSSSSSSSSSYSSSSASSSSSSSSSRPSPVDITSRWFDDQCRGEARCNCDFAWCLVPGASNSVVTGVFAPNRAWAQAQGNTMCEKESGKEWVRLEELTMKKKPRARREQTKTKAKTKTKKKNDDRRQDEDRPRAT